MVKTGVTNVLSFLLNNDIYDADRIENDRDLLRRFYLAHGYADVRVSSSASYDADTKGVVVTFKIDEGPQYRLGKVEIEFKREGRRRGHARRARCTRRPAIFSTPMPWTRPSTIWRSRSPKAASRLRPSFRAASGSPEPPA